MSKERPGPEHARRELRRWLAEIGQTAAWLAGLLNCAPATVSRWLSEMNPGRYREPIEILSGGRVKATWWRTRAEWALIDRATEARRHMEASS
ncbi:MAG: hypothetical protein IT372_00105 [Polyangiaceae bacterium]|nr:hypothetical protein [Polyangiaceae bacterium]